MEDRFDPIALAIPLSEHELALGNFLLAETLGSKPDPESSKRAAKNWIRGQLGFFQSAICEDKYVRYCCLHPRGRDVPRLCATIFDLIAAQYSLYPVSTIVVMIVQMGIEQICISCDGHEDRA